MNIPQLEAKTIDLDTATFSPEGMHKIEKNIAKSVNELGLKVEDEKTAGRDPDISHIDADIETTLTPLDTASLDTTNQTGIMKYRTPLLIGGAALLAWYLFKK